VPVERSAQFAVHLAYTSDVWVCVCMWDVKQLRLAQHCLLKWSVVKAMCYY